MEQAIDATTPHGRAQIGMLAVFAKFEREMIAECVRASGEARARKGLPHGRLHYGYRINPDGKPSWLPHPGQVPVYRRLFHVLAGTWRGRANASWRR